MATETGTAYVPVTSGGELLDRMYHVDRADWHTVIAGRPVRILREAVDLCGIDAEGMTAKRCTRELLENFG